MQEIVINVPDNCEVQIVRKEGKKELVIKTYQDLIDNEIKIAGFFIDNISRILKSESLIACNANKNIAASEKVAKSMQAMAMISQLMPYYGGSITDEEWRNNEYKYIIVRYKGKIEKFDWDDSNYYFLAFHTSEQRDEFLKYNEQLVKDYLMID